jgi:hypothetical protein
MTRVAGTINFMVVPGVAAPGPAAPTVPDGWTSLAQVNVRANTTAVLQTDIVDERPQLKSLATHGHSGGIDGAKIDYSSLLNRPTPYNSYWKASTAYTVGDICYSSTGESYKRFECTVAGTSGAAEPTWPAVDSTVTDGTVHWKVRDIKNGSGEQVGSIKAWLAKAAPAGWLACDTGALVSRATYPQLWAWVQDNAPLITESAWQAQAAVQSSVGYYSSGDGSTTFRLPRLVDYIRGGLQDDVGTWQGDAIRDIIGGPWGGARSDIYAGSGAVIRGNVVGSGFTGTSNDTVRPYDFMASRVVPTADENRPKTIKFLYCIKAFDAPTNQGLVDITALANEVLALKNTVADIVSSGTNWIKFADGTMIQKATAVLVSNITVQTSYRYAVGTFTFPLAFVNTAYSTQFIHTGHVPVLFTEYNTDNSKTTSQVKCTAVGVVISVSGVADIRTDLPWPVNCVAIGRWKA